MKSRVEKWRIRISLMFCAVLSILVLFSGSGWEGRNPIVTALLFFAGMVLVGFATVGRLWCSLYIAGYKTRVLVDRGPYSISRNPLYFFSLTGFLGVGFCTETFLIPAIFAVAFAAYYPLVIASEERKLRNVHGESFDRYAAETPRFFPKPSVLKEPESYLVNPRVFRNHIFDAMLFVWFAGLVEIIEELHHLNWIHPFLTIY